MSHSSDASQSKIDAIVTASNSLARREQWSFAGTRKLRLQMTSSSGADGLA
jgi:hypothetical protein